MTEAGGLGRLPEMMSPEEHRRMAGCEDTLWHYAALHGNVRRALVRAGIEDCRRGTCCGILVLGHPDFYPRFGFSAELAETLESPFGGGPAWMALELTAGALHGTIGSVTYAPPFLELA